MTRLLLITDLLQFDSQKQPPPKSDHLHFAFWVVTYETFNYTSPTQILFFFNFLQWNWFRCRRERCNRRPSSKRLCRCCCHTKILSRRSEAWKQSVAKSETGQLPSRQVALSLQWLIRFTLAVAKNQALAYQCSLVYLV